MSEPYFPSTCDPVPSRREFLIGAALVAVAGASPVSAAGGDGIDVIREHAATPRDPWAVAHGVRAMGRDFTIEGGRRAVDFLLEEYVTPVAVNGRTVLAFPRTVEIHPNSFLKTMLEAGVPPSYSFVSKGSRRTLADLVEGARLLLRPKDQSIPLSELAWTIIALTLTTSPVRARWTNAWGEPVDLMEVVGAALDELEQASAPLSKAMRDGRPLSTKPRVSGFTCGGTHLIYSMITAAHAGYAPNDRAQRVRQQTELLLWRLGAEGDLIDRFYAQQRASASPSAPWLHLDTKVKFLGHAEECLALAARRKVVAFSPAQQAKRHTSVTELRRLLAEVESRDLAALRAAGPELYQQIVGDVCHARHGLTLS